MNAVRKTKLFLIIDKLLCSLNSILFLSLYFIPLIMYFFVHYRNIFKLFLWMALSYLHHELMFLNEVIYIYIYTFGMCVWVLEKTTPKAGGTCSVSKIYLCTYHNIILIIIQSQFLNYNLKSLFSRKIFYCTLKENVRWVS